MNVYIKREENTLYKSVQCDFMESVLVIETPAHLTFLCPENLGKKRKNF